MAAPNRQVLLVAALFAIQGTGAVIMVASGSLVGADLAGSDRLATVPVAFGVVGLVAATVPASKAMARWGRRAGFQLFAALGLAGALVCMLGVQRGSFALFCLGSFLVGLMGGAGQFYRFTAGEVAAPDAREKALGFVLAGGVVGGLLGPPAATAARDLWAAEYAAIYAVVAALCVVNLLLLPFLAVPRPPAAPTGAHARLRPDRFFLAAVLAGALAYGGMVLTMYAAPLSLATHGHGFDTSARVLQAHVIAMFLPSFFTGAFVQRVGPGRGMAGGLAAFAACVAVNVAGSSVLHHGVALVVLGLGWNLLFVSATVLLAKTHAGADKASAQGFNEFIVGGASAAAAFLAAPAHSALGWVGLNLAVALLVATGAVALLGLLGIRKTQASPPAATG